MLRQQPWVIRFHRTALLPPRLSLTFTILCAIGSLWGHLAVAAGPTLNVLAGFSVAAGLRNPSGAPLIADANGNFYGTTYQGGTFNNGAVFKYTASTQTLSVLAPFNGTNGTNPYSGVVADSSGNLFGVAYLGGANSKGVLFKVASGSSSVTDLVAFNGTNGANPRSLVTDGLGNFYGTTQKGGPSDNGTIFKYVPSTNTLTTLVTFNGTNGSAPITPVTLDGAGNIYGTTNFGGSNNLGTVFEIAAGTNAISTLVSFAGANGSIPATNVIFDKSGNLFGTTNGGGTSDKGTIFKIAAESQAFTSLLSFNGSNGNGPGFNLIMDSVGNLFGATDLGGTAGTVYRYSTSTNTLTTIASFDFGTTGEYPGGFYANSSGTIFGTAQMAGQNSDGTLFKILGAGFVVPETATGSLLASAFGTLLLLRQVRHRR